MSEPAIINQVVDYHDRVRWGPIIAGIVVAIATQLVLSALGAAIGLSISAGEGTAGDVGTGIGIWSVISLLIALFIGGWVTSSTCGPMNNKTALLHGLIFWATTLAVSSWLLASGVSGTFGAALANAGDVLNQVSPGEIQAPQVDAEEVAAYSARAAWWFIIGSLLGLVASLIGSSVGRRKSRVNGHRA
ncbi:MAG: hypothetical protein HC890_09465 [Chloroflexaceae bacterium]|nr:hypothetical protein [Chloroflexaceae bacterium]